MGGTWGRLRGFESCGYPRASPAPDTRVIDASMWSFALFAAALVAVTLVLLLRPLLSGKPPRSGGAVEDANLDIHRERLRDLESERREGRITAEEGLAAREEIERELLNDIDERESKPEDRSPAWRSALIVALAIPVLGLAIYFHLGTWHALVEVPGKGVPEESKALLESLEAAVRADPGNAEGWLRLGRAAVALERYHHGLQALAEAHRLAGDRPDILADYAEAEALLLGYRFQGEPARRLNRALEIDPRHAKALWLAGFAALQSARPELALERWESLLAIVDADSEQARMLEALIERTREETGETPLEAAEDPGETGPVLLVTLDIDERFRNTLDGSESLFIYARSTGGPPAPLAVRRESLRAFPLTLRLDDSMSMMPERPLSGAQRVEVGARISRSGDARASTGDIQGVSGPVEVRPGVTEVEVLLDERVTLMRCPWTPITRRSAQSAAVGTIFSRRSPPDSSNQSSTRR